MANTRELAQFASFVDFTGTSIGFSTQFNVSGVSTFTNTVIFDSTGSIQVPKGNTSQRLSGVLGQIRYNTQLSTFEGYGAGNQWGSLGGVKDVDADTLIRAESTAGADEDKLEFITADSTRLVIDSTGQVGIGSTIPTATLDVNGHTETDTLRVSGVSTFSANVDLGDNNRLRLGDDNELTIFHNGTNSYVANQITGNLIIQNGVDDKDIVLNCDDGSGGIANYFRADGSTGEAILYHYGSEKLSTKSNGIDVTGHTETDTLNVSGLSTFTGNIDANGDLDVDGHTELDNLNVSGVSTFQNNVHLLDDDKLLLGGSSGTHDGLEIYHDGNHSYIDDSGTGNLYLRSGTLSIQNLAGSKTSALFNSASGQELYYNNNKKFETTDGGIDVTGHTETDTLNVSSASTFSGPISVGDTISLGDGDRLRFGASNDLQIYHDGAISYISDQGSGALRLLGNAVKIRNAANNEQIANFTQNDSVELYYDNSLKFETTGIGVSILSGAGLTATIAGPPNLVIDPGTVGDNTGNVRIKGDLFVDGTTTQINSTALEIADFIVGIATTATSDALADGAGIQIGPSGNTFLYDNTNEAFTSTENLNVASGHTYKIAGTDVLSATTLGSGVVNSSLTSVGTLTGLTVSSDVSIADKIVHTGDTNTAIRFPAADTVTIETGGTEALRIGSDQKVYFGDFASVGSKAYILKEVSGDYKFNIFASSSTTTNRIITFNSREDVESMRLDSSGRLLIGTTTEGAALADNLTVADSADCGITIRSGISSYGSIYFSDATSGSDEYKGQIEYNHNIDSLRIYSGGTAVLRIDPGKLDVTGHTETDTLNVSGVSTFQGNVDLGDDVRLRFGDSQDLQIHSTGVNSVIKESGSGNLKILGTNIIFKNAGETKTYADFNNGNSVDLYYNNSKVFETTDGGIDVTGHTETDTLRVSGVSTFQDDVSIADKIVHTGDTNTSIRFPAADTFTVTTGGTERFRVKSDGNVGIGTNNPATMLDIRSSSNSTTDFLTLGADRNVSDTEVGISFKDRNVVVGLQTAARIHSLREGSADDFSLVFSTSASSADATEKLRITSDGTIGINNSNPSTTYKLNVKGAGVFNTDSNLESNDFNIGQLTVKNTQAAKGAFIDFRADSNNGTTGVIAKIGGFNTFNGTGYDGALTFSTRKSAGNTMNERLRITKDGYIGINTTPGTLLEIKGESSKEATVTFNRQPVQSTNDGVIGEFMFENATDSVALLAVKRESAADDAYFQFATQATSGGLTERLRISSNGNVGINTVTVPLAKLHISGSANAPCLVLPDTGNPRYSVGFGNINVFNVGQRLDFYVGDSGSNTANLTSAHRRMSLTSQGRLGIGEDNPDFKLHSNETGGSSIAGLFETNQTDAFISFQASGTTASSTVRIGALGDDFVAYVNGGYRLYITSTGDLKRPKSLSQEVSTSVSSTSATSCGSFAKATYRSAYVIAQITQGSSYQVGRYLVIHDGTTATTIEESAIATGDMLGTFSGVVSGSNVEFRVTMSSASSATVITKIESIVV